MENLTEKQKRDARSSYMAILIESILKGIPGADTVLNHSQQQLDAGTQRETPLGTNTFLGNVENIRGVNNGRPTIVPSFIDGVALPVGERGLDGRATDRARLAQRQRADWVRKSGKVWPSGDTIPEAVDTESLIHSIMELQRPRRQ
jgi:hypothetical protein